MASRAREEKGSKKRKEGGEMVVEPTLVFLCLFNSVVLPCYYLSFIDINSSDILQ